MIKLWLYTDFVNPCAWADSAESYRKIVSDALDAKPCTNTPVKVVHEGFPPPHGFVKGKDELAFTPVTKGRAKSKGLQNFYGDAKSILLEHLNMGAPKG